MAATPQTQQAAEERYRSAIHGHGYYVVFGKSSPGFYNGAADAANNFSTSTRRDGSTTILSRALEKVKKLREQQYSLYKKIAAEYGIKTFGSTKYDSLVTDFLEDIRKAGGFYDSRDSHVKITRDVDINNLIQDSANFIKRVKDMISLIKEAKSKGYTYDKFRKLHKKRIDNITADVSDFLINVEEDCTLLKKLYNDNSSQALQKEIQALKNAVSNLKNNSWVNYYDGDANKSLETMVQSMNKSFAGIELNADTIKSIIRKSVQDVTDYNSRQRNARNHRKYATIESIYDAIQDFRKQPRTRRKRGKFSDQDVHSLAKSIQDFIKSEYIPEIKRALIQALEDSGSPLVEEIKPLFEKMSDSEILQLQNNENGLEEQVEQYLNRKKVELGYAGEYAVTIPRGALKTDISLNITFSKEMSKVLGDQATRLIVTGVAQTGGGSIFVPSSSFYHADMSEEEFRESVKDTIEISSSQIDKSLRDLKKSQQEFKEINDVFRLKNAIFNLKNRKKEYEQALSILTNQFNNCLQRISNEKENTKRVNELRAQAERLEKKKNTILEILSSIDNNIQTYQVYLETNNQKIEQAEADLTKVVDGAENIRRILQRLDKKAINNDNDPGRRVSYYPKGDLKTQYVQQKLDSAFVVQGKRNKYIIAQSNKTYSEAEMKQDVTEVFSTGLDSIHVNGGSLESNLDLLLRSEVIDSKDLKTLIFALLNSTPASLLESNFSAHQEEILSLFNASIAQFSFDIDAAAQQLGDDLLEAANYNADAPNILYVTNASTIPVFLFQQLDDIIKPLEYFANNAEKKIAQMAQEDGTQRLIKTTMSYNGPTYDELYADWAMSYRNVHFEPSSAGKSQHYSRGINQDSKTPSGAAFYYASQVASSIQLETTMNLYGYTVEKLFGN